MSHMDEMNAGIRRADWPPFKNEVMGEIYGNIVAFVKDKGLKEGRDFNMAKKDLLGQKSVKTFIVSVSRSNDRYQLTVVMKALDMSVEYGVLDLRDDEVVLREKIKDLRYNISPGTDLRFTPGSQEKVDDVVTSIKGKFEELYENV